MKSREMEKIKSILEIITIFIILLVLMILIRESEKNRKMVQYAIDNQSMQFYQIYSVQQDLKVIKDFTGTILEITNQ